MENNRINFTEYREIDDMYYVGDIINTDGDGWIDRELFEILIQEYRFKLKELRKLKKLAWYRKNHKKLYRPVGENFKFIK